MGREGTWGERRARGNMGVGAYQGKGRAGGMGLLRSERRVGCQGYKVRDVMGNGKNEGLFGTHSRPYLTTEGRHAGKAIK